MDVARDRRLRDAAARAPQRVEQLLLCAELPALDEAQQQLLPLALPECSLAPHGAMFAGLEPRRKRRHAPNPAPLYNRAMMSAEETVHKAAHSLHGLARQRHIARILKAARTRGDAAQPTAPSGPQLDPQPAEPKPGPNPLVVVGVAFVAGYALAKVIDWRGRGRARS